MKKFDKLLSMLLSVTILGCATVTSVLAVNIEPANETTVVSAMFRETDPENPTTDPDPVDSNNSEPSEVPSSEVSSSSQASSSSSQASSSSSQASSSEPPSPSSSEVSGSEVSSGPSSVDSSSEPYEEPSEDPGYTDSSEDEDPGYVTPPDPLLPGTNESRNTNSDQDWSLLLSGIDSSNIAAIASGASNVVFSKPSSGAAAGSKGAGGEWILWLGIGLIALALIGIGLIVYFQFFAKSRRLDDGDSDFEEESLYGDTSEIIGIDDASPDETSADYGDDYNYYDDNDEDLPEDEEEEPTELPELDLNAPTEPSGKKGLPEDEDDDFWDRFFNK